MFIFIVYKLSFSSSPIVKILLGKLKGMSGPAAKAALVCFYKKPRMNWPPASNHYIKADIAQ